MKLGSVSSANFSTTLHHTTTPENLTTTPPVALSFLSKQDETWDKNRSYAEDVANIYTGTGEHTFDRLAQRIDDCSEFLTFNWQDNKQTGETALKLANAQFCRVRHCPVCQWRRSLMWKARFYEALPPLQEKHPTHRFIFLTLTVKNVAITGLRAQLQEMNKAWRKLVQRKPFKAGVAGFVRTTEITRNKKTNAAHPHYHALLIVKPSYFSSVNYIKQNDWAKMWQECLSVDYTPVVDVRVVKSKGKKGTENTPEALQSAITETLKYAVKPEDLVTNGPWLLELTKQVHKLRFIASGGLLKNALKEDQESNEDLIKTGLEEETKQAEEPDEIVFNWFPSRRQYLKYK